MTDKPTILHFDNQEDVLPVLHLLAHHRIDWQWVTMPNEISIIGDYIFPKELEQYIKKVSVWERLLDTLTYDNFMDHYRWTAPDQTTVSDVLMFVHTEIQRLIDEETIR